MGLPPPPPLRWAALLALAALAVAACDLHDPAPPVPDGTVAVTPVTDGGALFAAEVDVSPTARRASGAGAAFGCYAATETATGGHDLTRARLAFPDAVVARAGGRRRVVMFRVDRALGASVPTPGVSRTVRCVVPDDDEAVALAEEALGASGEPLWAAGPSGAETARRECRTVVVAVVYVQDCTESGGSVTCGPWRVERVVTEDVCESGGGGGRPGGHDPCDEGALMPPADREGMGCDYPGGGDPPLPDPDPPSCNVEEHPGISGEVASGEMLRLWESSGMGATEEASVPIGQRKENGSFVVRRGDGSIGYVPVGADWERTPCGMNPPPGWEDSIPEGTIGFVHTHPFFEGENTLGVCGQEHGSTYYTSGTNQDDLYFLSAITSKTGNYSAKLYILDGDVGVFIWDFIAKSQPLGKCGHIPP